MVSFNRFLVAAFALVTASTTLAMPFGNATLDTRAPVDLNCGSDRAPKTGLATADEGRLKPGAMSAAAPLPRVVNVYWNVIYATNTYAGGYLSAAQVDSSIRALNSHFSATGISFRRVGLKYTRNANWFHNVENLTNGGLALANTMKSTLRLGTAKDLNIYSVGFTTSTLGGFATFPWWYAGAPKTDGVIFKWNTIPGGSLPNYNQGKILTHEVGHWCGLYHTFQGGCSATAGDFVSDTPAQASASTGCPVGRNSCTKLPGLDPIRNHMDYTYDTCKTSPFTPGQIERMRLALSIYRK